MNRFAARAARALALLGLCAAARPAPAAAAPAAPADTFKVKVSARLQTLYQYSRPDAAADAKVYGSAAGTRPLAQSTSLLRIRRGRLVMEGFAWDPGLEYNLQLELAGPGVTLKRAYVNWRAHGPELQLRAGKFKVPFGRQQLTSSAQQQVSDRSAASDEFAKGDDDGLMVWGLPAGGRVEYYAGVFNGEGNNHNSQQDARDQLAARFVVAPLGAVPYTGPALDGPRDLRVAFGIDATRNGGWLQEVNGVAGMQAPTRTCTPAGCSDDHGDDARITALGADAALRWRGLSASAELFRRTAAPRQAGLAERRAEGWYAQGGAFLVPARLEAGIRVSGMDLDTSRPMDRTREVTPFVNGYLHGHDLKLQADYGFLRTEVPDARAGGTRATWLAERRLRVQFQLQLHFQPPH